MKVAKFVRFLPMALVALTALSAARRPNLVVSQKNRLFSATAVSIAVGDSISFVNADDVSHNVFSSTSGLTFNLKRQAPGTQRSVAFTTPGTALVRCAFHPNMKITVTVR